MPEAQPRVALLSPCAPRGASGRRSSRAGLEAGFTYLGVLFLIVLIGLGLAAVAHVWHVSMQRDKEAELLFVGSQFRDAITRYSQMSPGTIAKQEFPQRLEDLLEDKRFGTPTMRHLRKIYLDPMTGKADWVLVTLPGVGIIGVHSKSEETPIKSAGFPAEYNQFTDAKAYTDWVFGPTSAPGAAAPAGSAPGGVSPTGGLPPPVAGPGSGTPGATGAPMNQQPIHSDSPTSARSEAEAQCQVRYAVAQSECEAATQRGGKLGGQSCQDRAFQQLNTCWNQAARL